MQGDDNVCPQSPTLYCYPHLLCLTRDNSPEYFPTFPCSVFMQVSCRVTANTVLQLAFLAQQYIVAIVFIQ